MASPPSTRRPWPEAVVIRSGPAPPKRTEDVVESSLEHALPNEVVWREWAINPAKHGPERMTRPPIFVPSQGCYDEMGRSVMDGVEVDVDAGTKETKRNSIQDGQSVSEWYASFSRSGTLARKVLDSDSAAGPSRSQTVHSEVIDMTNDDDDDHPAKSKVHAPPRPIRVKQTEWFIRRALLKAHTKSEQPTAPAHRPSSIASMINEDGPRPRPTPQPKFVLGPENKGYSLLKDTLGWSGGGLGRPVGWVPPDEQTRGEESDKDTGPLRPLPTTDTGAIDLTVVSGSDSEPDTMSDVETTDPGSHGPGRVAPIPTALKLDRLGLGHARSQKDAKGNSTKKVTHTHSEILAAQRRARYRPPGDKVELGKKGRIKWKEKDKKERAERRRVIAALNS